MKNKPLLLFSLTAFILFVIFYMVAACLYPGGNQVNHAANGFSIVNNYWCDLLGNNAVNGKTNTAKPYAIAGWFIVCIGMITFWFAIPAFLLLEKMYKKVIQLTGILTMLIAMLLFTHLHDFVINAAGICGVIALMGLFAGLYKNKWLLLFYSGIGCLLLMLVNYYIVITGNGLVALPLIQKITFLLIMAWLYTLCRKALQANKV